MERLEVKLYIEDALPIFSPGLRETSLKKIPTYFLRKLTLTDIIQVLLCLTVAVCLGSMEGR